MSCYSRCGSSHQVCVSWISLNAKVLVEVARRSVNSCYPKNINKANSDLDSLKKPLLEPVDKSECPYSCCSPFIHTYQTDTEEFLLSNESTEETVSSEEIEECEESLVDNRRAGKQVVKENNGVQEGVGKLYSYAVPGRPKLVLFEVSDDYFRVSDVVGARLVKEEASAKIHPHPGVTNPANSSMRNSSSQFYKGKQIVPFEEIIDEHRILPPMIQEVVSSHSSKRNFPGSDENWSSEGRCSYKIY